MLRQIPKKHVFIADKPSADWTSETKIASENKKRKKTIKKNSINITNR